MVDDGPGDLEKAGDELLHCPICYKEFVCKYSLESHVEAHSENPLRWEAAALWGQGRAWKTHTEVQGETVAWRVGLPKVTVGPATVRPLCGSLTTGS